MAGNRKSSKTSKSKNSKSGSDSNAGAVLATVKALPSEDQLAALTTRFTELSSQNGQLQSHLASAAARYEASEKSKIQLNTDYTKAMLSKAQLESLCRELQKQNKLTKEENLARIREEEEKRRDVSTRLNNTLSDITGLMQQNTEKNSELRKENQNMASRLNDLVTQYESRQQSIDKILKQRDLQLQLAEAKLAKALIEGAEEREGYLKDKKKMLEELQAYQDRVTRMTATEIALREQLTKYANQYDEFQKTVESSNTIMNKFKKEMDLMAKKIKKLEKETLQWQVKWQKSNTTLIDMVEERGTLMQRNEKLTKQNNKLQQLGRTLQAQLVEERNSNKGIVRLAAEKTVNDACPNAECPAQEKEDKCPDPNPSKANITESGATACVKTDSTSLRASPENNVAANVEPLEGCCSKLADVCLKSVECSQVVETCCKSAEQCCKSAEQCCKSSGSCSKATKGCQNITEGCSRSSSDVAAESQLSEVQAKLTELQFNVADASLTDVITKESTIEITEL
uniref:Beta-taxilin-like n=2 Tax=Hirondellea gigas TaxID=1518452 RepID=A0A2P2I1N1_9CRUS